MHKFVRRIDGLRERLAVPHPLRIPADMPAHEHVLRLRHQRPHQVLVLRIQRLANVRVVVEVRDRARVAAQPKAVLDRVGRRLQAAIDQLRLHRHQRRCVRAVIGGGVASLASRRALLSALALFFAHGEEVDGGGEGGLLHGGGRGHPAAPGGQHRPCGDI